MRTGDLDAVIVVPGRATAPARRQPRRARGRRPRSIGLHRPVQPTAIGIGLPGRSERARGREPGRPAAARRARGPQTVQTENLNFISYFVPSILGLSVMQLGIFAAIPLVADREKLILKRLAATPLRRWQLVGSNMLMRLLIALVQSVIIVGVGVASSASRSRASCCWPRRSSSLGAVTFLALGYVIASFAKTEDAANGMTSVVQFPMMFLSGMFFPIARCPPSCSRSRG